MILSHFMNVSGLTSRISPFCFQGWASTVVLSSYYFLGHHHCMTLTSQNTWTDQGIAQIQLLLAQSRKNDFNHVCRAFIEHTGMYGR
jgi:hypothetical protein